MKTKWLRLKDSRIASLTSCAHLLGAVATIAFVLLSTNASLAQGQLATDASKMKSEKAPNPISVAARPLNTKPDSSSFGGEGLSACNQTEAKSFGLRSPGGKPLVQFDKCYRGRAHNVCLSKALSVMMASLRRDYEKLVETNYPSIASTSGVCAFKISQLSDDFETSKAFHARYKALVEGYDERLRCTDLVLKSLEKVALPDLPNVEKIVKSMAEDLKSDVAQFAKERQAADELLAKVTESQKTLEVQSDVHRAMCMAPDGVGEELRDQARSKDAHLQGAEPVVLRNEGARRR
jgi:hypothetical protein